MVVETATVVAIILGGISGIKRANRRTQVEKPDLKVVESVHPYENPSTAAELKALDRWFSSRE